MLVEPADPVVAAGVTPAVVKKSALPVAGYAAMVVIVALWTANPTLNITVTVINVMMTMGHVQ
ncbi:hypothetical protein A2886_02360 [candidate division WWE3 bacterium RIFCSPHIGHO2_01_FULL_42_13]|uniref:Uncharacterized protein n=1 Tax=candidate division WWE3 bacterium RIFCSPHIGHO2_01_FULL_42_13 TaxID=1802617 RepID=A0A1F4URK2_UNCKA|nr:MAG: hypothetical protein A2886_02360 [candidate division WWE3 bacterium RIFCSPHIGHO2_01_FULL_42_13]